MDITTIKFRINQLEKVKDEILNKLSKK